MSRHSFYDNTNIDTMNDAEKYNYYGKLLRTMGLSLVKMANM